MAVLLFSGIALQLANPQVIRYFIDTAQQGGSTQSLWTAALLFIVFAILQQAFSLAAGYISKSVGWTATNQLRADLLRHVLHLDMPFHKTHTPGELIDRIDGDVNQLANFFSLFSISVLGNGLLVVGILALLFRENAGLGLGMLVYTALVLLVLRWIQSLAVPRWSAERQAGTELYSYLEERISGAEEIRALGVEAYAMRRLFALMRTFTEKTRIASVISGLTYNLTNLVFVLGYAAGLSVSVYLFTRGQASLGTAYLITYYIGMLSEPLQAIRSQSEDLQQATANIQRVQQLFNLALRLPTRRSPLNCCRRARSPSLSNTSAFATRIARLSLRTRRMPRKTIPSMTFPFPFSPAGYWASSAAQAPENPPSRGCCFACMTPILAA